MSSTKEQEKRTHKMALRGSSKLVAEFFEYSINTILFQRGVYPPEDFTPVKKYGLNMLVTSDDQVKAYIKKIMSQLSKWTVHGKISKLVIVITSKETGEHVERWQFDVQMTAKPSSKTKKPSKSTSIDQENANPDAQPSTSSTSTSTPAEPSEEQKTDAQIQSEIQSLFRQITASVTFLPTLDSSDCTFNVLVYADADSEVPLEWGDSDAKEVVGAEKVMLRGFSTNSHRVDTVVSYRMGG